LYPATFDCEVSASICCVRDSVRGKPSRLIAVTPRAASPAARSGSVSGASMPNTACPARSPASTPDSGLATVTIASAAASSSSRDTMVAPACA
jgi:hypothetical protein